MSMNRIALKILFGDRGKYLGIITGIALASLIMIQQPGILISILSHTYSFISDINLPDIWVMDPKVQFIDDSKPLLDTQLYRVRGVQGVEWAMPLYKGSQRVRLDNGEPWVASCWDWMTPRSSAGPRSCWKASWPTCACRTASSWMKPAPRAGWPTSATPGGKSIPLQVGDVLEINDKRATVVGIARGTPTFQSQPILYTTYTRAKNYALSERKLLSYILVKAKADESPQAVARRITRQTGLAAYTAAEFKPVAAIFHSKHQHSHQLRLRGRGRIYRRRRGHRPDLLQLHPGQLALLRGLQGHGSHGPDASENDSAPGAAGGLHRLRHRRRGSGVFAAVTRGSSDLTMQLNWQLLLGSGMAVLLIVVVAALVSVRKVMKLEPAEVFKG